jgi:hypothetical protein
MTGRRDFFKKLGLGIGALAAAPLVKKVEAIEQATIEKDAAVTYTKTTFPDETTSVNGVRTEWPKWLENKVINGGSGNLLPLGEDFKIEYYESLDDCIHEIHSPDSPSPMTTHNYGVSPLSGTLDLWDTGTAKGLRAQRDIREVDSSFFMDQVAEKGSVVTYDGISHPECPVECVRLQQGDEPVAGILLNDVVNIDLTNSHYPLASDVMKGGKVQVLRKGTIITRPLGEPTPGANAYANGSYITTDYSDSSVPQEFRLGVARKIGTFLSGKDQDGFAKVSITNL